jgi:hypothetical protein
MLVCETPHVIPRSMTTRGLWRQQVQLSRGTGGARTGGCHPQRGWRESVTVTWSPAPAPAPDRRAAAGTGAAAAGNPRLSGAVITTTQTLTYLDVRAGWPGKSRDLLRAPQNPHKSATRRRIPTGIPRTERHTPVHLFYVLKARRIADQQPQFA